MSKELEALSELYMLAIMRDNSKRGMSAHKMADNANHLLKQALNRLAEIESASGSEILKELDEIYNKPFDIIKLDNAPLSAIPQFSNFAKKVYNYILKQEEFREKVKRYFQLNDLLENGDIDDYEKERIISKRKETYDHCYHRLWKEYLKLEKELGIGGNK